MHAKIILHFLQYVYEYIFMYKKTKKKKERKIHLIFHNLVSLSVSRKPSLNEESILDYENIDRYNVAWWFIEHECCSHSKRATSRSIVWSWYKNLSEFVMYLCDARLIGSLRTCIHYTQCTSYTILDAICFSNYTETWCGI